MNDVICHAAGMPDHDFGSKRHSCCCEASANPETAARACGLFQSLPPRASLTRPGGMGLSGGAAGMVAGRGRLLAVLALLFLPVTAVAPAIPPGAQPGREREQMAPPGQGPHAPPGGATITLP